MMKKYLALLISIPVLGNAQLTYDGAKSAFTTYQFGEYSYFEDFVGKSGYASGVILATDGGALGFGLNANPESSGALLVKLDQNGVEQWKRLIETDFDEMETQGVIQDATGNIYTFMLSYNYEKYRGGNERVVCFSSQGDKLWDKTLGGNSGINNPVISYIHALSDGRIALRGHMAPDEPEEGKDPQYHYWEGWLTVSGELIQNIGGVIDWSNSDWQQWYKPE